MMSHQCWGKFLVLLVGEKHLDIHPVGKRGYSLQKCGKTISLNNTSKYWVKGRQCRKQRYAVTGKGSSGEQLSTFVFYLEVLYEAMYPSSMGSNQHMQGGASMVPNTRPLVRDEEVSVDSRGRGRGLAQRIALSIITAQKTTTNF